jgi:hypothetical protein
LLRKKPSKAELKKNIDDFEQPSSNRSYHNSYKFLKQATENNQISSDTYNPFSSRDKISRFHKNWRPRSGSDENPNIKYKPKSQDVSSEPKKIVKGPKLICSTNLQSSSPGSPGMLTKKDCGGHNIGYRERLSIINSLIPNGSPAMGNLDFGHGVPSYCFENFSD